ncbi:MAG: Gfo/Idh/MocA family protein [Puniceicoccaceae bacterium]
MDRNLGIIGLGEGKSILGGAEDSEYWKTALICDLDEALCRQRQQEYGIPAYTTDYAAMLADPEIDAVGIYTPDPLHAEHIALALRAGKHVICTKPLLTDLTRGAELLQLQRESGKQVLVGQSCRFFPTFMRQREDFESGQTGTLRSVEAHYHGDKRGGTSGKWGRKGGNDWIFTGLVHPADLAYWYLGGISEVTGFAVTSDSSKGRDGPEDIFHFVLKNEAGAIAMVSGAFGTPSAHPQAQSFIECTVRGETGTLSAKYPDFRYFTAIDGRTLSSEDYTYEHAYYFRFGGSSHHVGEFRNYLEYFGKCLDDEAPSRPGLVDGLRVIATLTAMKTAIREERIVRVSEILEAHNLGDL